MIVFRLVYGSYEWQIWTQWGRFLAAVGYYRKWWCFNDDCIKDGIWVIRVANLYDHNLTDVENDDVSMMIVLRMVYGSYEWQICLWGPNTLGPPKVIVFSPQIQFININGGQTGEFNMMYALLWNKTLKVAEMVYLYTKLVNLTWFTHFCRWSHLSRFTRFWGDQPWP